MATLKTDVPATPPVSGTVRSSWRRLTQDEDVPGLVAQFALAQTDAARAQASLDGLVSRCRPVAEEIARTYVSREEDLADLVQEALLLLSRDLPHLRQPAAFPSWFATVVHNVCRRWLRRARARRTDLSLDAPPRPSWLADSDAAPTFDLADAGAACAFLHPETNQQLGQLLQLLPAQQRAALPMAYLEGLSHEQIGRQIGVTPRAAEGLVYRGLRRLQAIMRACDDEPEELATWCPRCGQRRLRYQTLPGIDPWAPLWQRWRCPACGLASSWIEPNNRRLAQHPSPEAAWWIERTPFADEAQRLARTPNGRCWKCGEPLIRRDRPPAATASGTTPYILHWSCFRCDVGTYYGYLHTAIALPQWLAFWRTAPRLLIESERLVKEGGEERIALTARDRDSGRRATLAVDRATLVVRRFALEGG